MAKTYRATQQWDHWLTQVMGTHVLEAERHFLHKLLAHYFGRSALLIGVPQQDKLLKMAKPTWQFLLTPMIAKNCSSQVIEGDFYELPIASGSVDLVIVPHTLEYIHNPRQLLAEACRIVKPEGHLVLLGFNPVSLWGLKKMLTRTKHTPWTNSFLRPGTVKKWLGFADFQLMKQDTLLFRPPVRQHWYRRLKFLEWIGRKLFKPWGGVYVLVAQAKVVPLTPIRLRWQQTLSSLNLPLTGPTMRDRV